ncbi:MAG TPA: S8 family peptidase [Steroidobacteraceae bacterium]|nr:S8 family peptidase [Steroidobacteraceae bacterium]
MHKKQLLTMLATTAFAVTAALSVPTSQLSAATSGKARPASASNKAYASQGREAWTPKANGVFIVRMADAPVAGYDGRIKGYAATRPAAGSKIDLARPETQNYRALLRQKQDAVLAKVGGQKIYSYDLVFNGFAAKLTDAQAEKLATMPGVLAVTRDEVRSADTSSTPAFLGLTQPGSLWWWAGGPRNAGDGVVVGIIDSGITPENPSFANVDRHSRGHGGRHQHHRGDDDGHGYGHSDPGVHGWTGYCEDGEDFVGEDACNGKIIGARYFNEAWGGDAAIEADLPWEFTSPRDYDGHGTHTSGTAAGNYKTPVTGPAAVYGPVSGMAPGARIAMYKALWSVEDASTANGYTSDLVAAIDQAVADGVDVINYSVSGTTTNFRDPVEISFLFAADAGVFVAASAGNSGPTTGTVAHPSPWITTVAAGTHNRSAVDTVTLGNGVTYTGVGLASSPVTAPLIYSSAAAAAGADPTAARLCFSTGTAGGTAQLDPALVAGKIVVCDRGTNARVDKSLAVQEAGGVGMILVNTSPNSLNADFHSVPTVHLQNTDRAAVLAYAATSGATATINTVVFDYSTPAPYTASFSSRGPLTAGAGDLLKPDIIAPGQDILAAFSPSVGGLDFNLLSGTSMSSPHIAGLAAVMKDVHPRWSPMMIKSALMTTATDVLDGPPTDPTVIFRQGAGHVAPNKAIDPGLVFDSGWNDWLGFLCGTQLPAVNCTSSGIPVLDPSDFNSPSIAIGDLAGSQTVTRTLKNVSWRSTYKVSVTGLEGTTVTVSPSTFTINPNKTQKVSITVTRTTAALNAYVGGYITWSDGWHKVRIPVVVKPVALGAPAQVSGSYTVKFGYDGPFSATARGLVPAMTFPGTVSNGAYAGFVVPVPAGTTYARFSLFDTDVSPASDLDLRVFRINPDNTLTQVGGSGGGTSAEEVNLLNPTAANYYMVVDGYATANPSSFTAYAWALGGADAGNMTVTAPAAAALGATGNIGLSFTGLTPGVKYLGSVAYGGAASLPNPTIVRVDP